MKRIKFIIYPILFALYPILYLYSRNKYLLKVSDILPSALFVSGITILLLWLLIFISGTQKASIIISLFLIFVFSYGYVYEFIKKIVINPNHSYMITIWLIMFIFLIYTVLKSTRNVTNLNIFFNLMAVSLIMIPLFDLVFHGFRKMNLFSEKPVSTIEINNEESNGSTMNVKNLPDIYYIILDGYGRTDILEEIYNYDNSQFINWLTNKGFYIAGKSKANYCQSCLSVASFLNFKYINFLNNELGKTSQNRNPLTEMIQGNEAARFLKRMGYKFINFPIGYFCLNESSIADLNIDTGSVLGGEMFENMLIYRTVLKPFLENIPWITQGAIAERRRRILNIFSSLEKIPNIEASTFTYAHVIAPHPPFIFGADGKEAIYGKFCLDREGDWWWKVCGTKEEYIEGYRNQLAYISKKAQETIEKILAKPGFPPIIILQADHGPGAMLEWENPERTNMKERMSILNAYYLPDGGDKFLYDSITPVNTFRIIFNHYFGTDYEILEDKSYFSTWSSPYDFMEVLREENNS